MFSSLEMKIYGSRFSFSFISALVEYKAWIISEYSRCSLLIRPLLALRVVEFTSSTLNHPAPIMYGFDASCIIQVLYTSPLSDWVFIT